MKKSLAFIIKFFISLSIIIAVEHPLYAGTENGKISLAVYPFNDVRRNSLDMDIPLLLSAELSGYEFIEIVPVEVIREKLYEIEPQFMWTEKKDSVKRGGILWKIEQRIVEKINDAVNARYSLYGDLMSFGDRWRVDAFLAKEGETDPVRTLRFNGMNFDELPAKMTGISKSIAEVLKGESVLNTAEEDIRQYKGGMISHDMVISMMKKHISAVPESIPLRGLLLDLYLEDTEGNAGDILSAGLKIIGLMKETANADTRYLLSLALDPFDAVAAVYEKKQEWDNAVVVRDKALRSFSYNPELHKERIGRDYYFIAKSFEEKGSRKKALEHYKTAISYLQPSSGYFKEATDGIDRLIGNSNNP